MRPDACLGIVLVRANRPWILGEELAGMYPLSAHRNYSGRLLVHYVLGPLEIAVLSCSYCGMRLARTRWRDQAGHIGNFMAVSLIAGSWRSVKSDYRTAMYPVRNLHSVHSVYCSMACEVRDAEVMRPSPAAP